MEQKVMGLAMVVIVTITVALSFVLMSYPQLHNVAESMEEQREGMVLNGQSVFDLLKGHGVNESDAASNELLPVVEEDKLKGQQFRLTLPDNIKSDAVSVESDYVNKITRVSIKGITNTYFDDYPMIGNPDNIVDVVYSNLNRVGSIDIAMDKVKEIAMTTEGNYLYLDFIDAKDIYEHVVVIDAGHGGKAPGATKQGVSEKNIDLDIVLALKELFDEKPIPGLKVYYTRTTDVNPAFMNRVGLANDTKADVFVSVHNNSTKSGRMSGTSGTEVMYHETDRSGESLRLSMILLDNLIESLGTKNKGTVKGDEIYIIREAKVPVALIEVGFMTNKTELNNLCDEEYQKMCAQAIYDGIMEYIYHDLGENEDE